jgi:hypothetical protein
MSINAKYDCKIQAKALVEYFHVSTDLFLGV